MTDAHNPCKPLGMTDPLNEASGHDRRAAIAQAVAQSDHGWLSTVDLGEMLGIDRATIYHHAQKMVEMGTAALGNLRRIGEPGRPARVVLDPHRLHDIPSRFTITEPNPRTGTPVHFECEIVVSDTPETVTAPRMGPVMRALRDGVDTDDLAAAITRQVSEGILNELLRGDVELIIRPRLREAPAASTEETDQP